MQSLKQKLEADRVRQKITVRKLGLYNHYKPVLKFLAAKAEK